MGPLSGYYCLYVSHMMYVCVEEVLSTTKAVILYTLTLLQLKSRAGFRQAFMRGQLEM